MSDVRRFLNDNRTEVWFFFVFVFVEHLDRVNLKHLQLYNRFFKMYCTIILRWPVVSSPLIYHRSV